MNLHKLTLLYELYGFGMLVSLFVYGLWIWITATIHGIETGDYYAVALTNLIGENYIELFLLLIAIPPILVLFVQVSINFLTRYTGLPCPEKYKRLSALLGER